MISFLITAYRARHVTLCRWPGLSGTRCPAKDA